MKKKYYCNRCLEDITAKVERKIIEQQTIFRLIAVTDFRNNQKETIFEEVVHVKCSKGHLNIFKL